MDFKKWGKDELQDSPKQSEQPSLTESQGPVTSNELTNLTNDLQAFYSTGNTSGAIGPQYYSHPIQPSIVQPYTWTGGTSGTWPSSPAPDEAALLARIDALEGKINEIHEMVEHLKDAISIFTKLVNFD